MAKKYKVSWSQESKRQVDNILTYLRQNFGEQEAANFLDLLFHFERTIAQFPKAFKASAKFKNCRLGLVHKHVTAIYKISGSEIFILTVFDNRANIQK